MKILGGLGLALLLASGCGDSGPRADARRALEVCDEMCGWPDECLTQLEAPVQGEECVQACEAQVEVVGIECISAISLTFACLGTCDFESLSQADLLECQDAALAIDSACQ